MNGPRYRAGMVVEVIGPIRSPHPGATSLVGKQFRLFGEPLPLSHPEYPEGLWYWGLPTEWTGGVEWVAEEQILRPLNDGDCRSTWKDCAWKPKELAST